jgi:hypothetical protein
MLGGAPKLSMNVQAKETKAGRRSGGADGQIADAAEIRQPGG